MCDCHRLAHPPPRRLRRSRCCCAASVVGDALPHLGLGHHRRPPHPPAVTPAGSVNPPAQNVPPGRWPKVEPDSVQNRPNDDGFHTKNDEFYLIEIPPTEYSRSVRPSCKADEHHRRLNVMLGRLLVIGAAVRDGLILRPGGGAAAPEQRPDTGTCSRCYCGSRRCAVRTSRRPAPPRMLAREAFPRVYKLPADNTMAVSAGDIRHRHRALREQLHPLVHHGEAAWSQAVHVARALCAAVPAVILGLAGYVPRIAQ